MKLNKLVLAFCLASVTSFFSTTIFSATKEQKIITIGTGGVTGVYYPAGGAICRLVNKSRKEHGVRCSVESTSGGVYNLTALREGELEMGVVQSDSQYYAYNGISKFQVSGPDKKLRAVFALHAEPFTVVARAGAGIASFSDLKGKRVNVGSAGTGQRSTMEVLMAELGWKLSDFKEAHELKPSDQSKALCDNSIDAMIYVVGHPTGAIKEATTACDSVLVAVDGPEVDKLIKNNPYYRKAVIPGGMYRGNPKDVTTFGVGATFVTTSDLSEEVVYQITKSVFTNIDEFRRLHPAFEYLSLTSMVKDGLSAPLHRGAVKYYKEAGLLE